MARGSGVPKQHHATAVVSKIPQDAPPPSTRAAQIVQDLSEVDGNQQEKTREKLEELITELLGTEGSSLRDENAIDAGLNLNSKLIIVVTRAGLEILCHDDPFANLDYMLPQASNSLLVIESAIERAPKVLFTDVFEDAGASQTPPLPLYIWLLPRIIVLLEHENADGLKENLIACLRTVLQETFRCSSTWSESDLVTSYIRCCITSILSYLEDESSSAAIDAPSFKITLPPNEVFSRVARDPQSELDRNAYQFSINETPRAFSMALILGSLLTDGTKDQASRPPTHTEAKFLKSPLNSLHSSIQYELCMCLVTTIRALNMSPSSYEAISEFLLPVVQELIRDEHRLASLSQDLQSAIRIVPWKLRTSGGEFSGTRRNASVREFNQSPLTTSTDLHLILQEYLTQFSESRQNISERPLKRQRLSLDSTQDSGVQTYQDIVQKVYMLLGYQGAMDLDGLSRIAVNVFDCLPAPQQCEALKHLGDLACAGAGALNLSTPRTGQGSTASCSTCGSDSVPGSQRALWEGTQNVEVFLTLKNLLEANEFRSSTSSRLWGMLAVRKVLSHSDDSVHLDLAVSPLGQWCLQSLCSSLRELRIAAGRALTAFLLPGFDQSILHNNMIIVLDFLRRLSAANELALQETCVMAWGQVACLCSDDELNIVLLRLVEYLGYTNPLVSGLAYNELLKISSAHSMTPRQLLSPFWRSIATTVIKDLQTRPQTAQGLSDLLGFNVSDLLVLTQSHTLPYLILSKKKEVIKRIAQARNDGSTIWSMCYEKANMAAILALLLVQQSTDVEKTTMALLCNASEEFKEFDLVELARSDPTRLACELLKAAGEEDAIQGLHLLANLAHRPVGQSKPPVKKGNLVYQFFETHVLGIMAQFSDAINEAQGRVPTLEKKRCLKGIQSMCRIAKGYISNALPQIRACLQSALEVDGLRDQGFLTWSTMMAMLQEEEIGTMIENTFCIVVQYWDVISPLARENVRSMITQLLKRHSKLIRENVDAIPSLSSIGVLSAIEADLSKMRASADTHRQLQSYIQRCQHESTTVVNQALRELANYLQKEQNWVHVSAVSEQPNTIIVDLIRTILDVCVRFADSRPEISSLCGRCIGSIGCLDPNRVETVREKPSILILSNFEKADEAIDWAIFFLEEILVKAFLSATNTRAQGFLAYTMQELLSFCGFSTSATIRGHDTLSDDQYRRWVGLPEIVRNTLTPFLTSSYLLSSKPIRQRPSYPIFDPNTSHSRWLREFSHDLLEKGTGENAHWMFQLCSRIIYGQDISIAGFLLPYVALNVVIGGTIAQAQEVGQELVQVLEHQSKDDSSLEENLKLCSETVFQILDYLSRWMQEQKRQGLNSRSSLARKEDRRALDDEYTSETSQVQRVEKTLSKIRPEIISRRAVECRSYARALFHWEQHIRQVREKSHQLQQQQQPQEESLFQRLQDIYSQIEEPDGVEGISAHLHVLDIDQQILEHRKAGRWAAVQSWYELLLAQNADDIDLQVNLVTCLRESGQFDLVLNQVDSVGTLHNARSKLLPFAVEASWATSKWARLIEYLRQTPESNSGDFNVRIGYALMALHQKDYKQFSSVIEKLHEDIAKGLSKSSTASLQACHNDLLKFHALNEVEAIGGCHDGGIDKSSLMETLDRRLDVLGAFLSDKQYLLGLRRATMQLSRHDFTKDELASVWLTSARLARKGNLTHQSFNAVLHASQLGAESATIEHSRLLWNEGHHRKAIQSLDGAIVANAFSSYSSDSIDEAKGTAVVFKEQQQNLVTARAHLLLTKWLDSAGQSQSQLITAKYRKAANTHIKWEKGHYYLGRHYNKLLESEKALPPSKQAASFINGETAKLVIESYLRSMCYGAKYIFQTLPRILTLWLELGAEVESPIGPQYGSGDDFRKRMSQQRQAMLEAIHTQLKKYMERLPAFTFYTALQQIVARICHPNSTVFDVLQRMIIKVVSGLPQQALWTLLAVVKSSSKDRATRGATCLAKIKDSARRTKIDSNGLELRSLINQGQKLSDQLLEVCEIEIHGKPSVVSLTKDLLFNSKTTPCSLVVPLEKTLTASLPTIPNTVRSHKAFASDTVTISQFLDNVLVLNSLQRPRKVCVRGSDGRIYGLLCKPKDDLRKDQRLMEFNAMINRSLKKDAESSKRQLYIKTYAVTPLNEECGLIEWIDNLKTLRDILLKLYKSKGISPNYGEIRMLLDEANSDPSKLPIFTEKVLPNFPPIFHEWFVELFPEPSAWFNARLRYTRSCAVMSMVGMTLGLGDRHGENILFEEGNGGTFHVDFNCLFDKGLTFDKPEMVPFRLTHNMVDAFGVYGYEGPYRKSCELTLKILRQNENTLLTILETFVYDPTTDFIGKKKRANKDVPGTPQEVLDSVQSKVRGLLRGESVPLSVEGHVHELIQQATDPQNLAAMYIGWCAFF
ncbi:MAG: serine/threonine-protein kinase M1 [Sclerophora amabilis]|nr:MAG: serine/threonine-protein kinase M1 [Sclerophora amabilis]